MDAASINQKGDLIMTDTHDTQTGQKGGKAPSHIVWFVPERENAPWTRIGAQWPTKTGKGFNQVLDLLPLGEGHILVLPNEPKEMEAGA
jgi:hypothetical protein